MVQTTLSPSAARKRTESEPRKAEWNSQARVFQKVLASIRWLALKRASAVVGRRLVRETRHNRRVETRLRQD